MALKHSVTVLNTPGTIDEGYRGEVGVILINHGKQPIVIEKHMTIAKMVIKLVLKVNVIEVNKLAKTERLEVDSVPLTRSSIVTLKANEAGCIHIC